MIRGVAKTWGTRYRKSSAIQIGLPRLDGSPRISDER
jgi:hypothetical protein